MNPTNSITAIPIIIYPNRFDADADSSENFVIQPGRAVAAVHTFKIVLSLSQHDFGNTSKP